MAAEGLRPRMRPRVEVAVWATCWVVWPVGARPAVLAAVWATCWGASRVGGSAGGSGGGLGDLLGDLLGGEVQKGKSSMPDLGGLFRPPRRI